MDPVVNLKEQVHLALAIIDTWDNNKTLSNDLKNGMCYQAEELARRVVGLYTWRKAGGFDPYPTCQIEAGRV